MSSQKSLQSNLVRFFLLILLLTATFFVGGLKAEAAGCGYAAGWNYWGSCYGYIAVDTVYGTTYTTYNSAPGFKGSESVTCSGPPASWGNGFFNVSCSALTSGPWTAAPACPTVCGTASSIQQGSCGYDYCTGTVPTNNYCNAVVCTSGPWTAAPACPTACGTASSIQQGSCGYDYCTGTVPTNNYCLKTADCTPPVPTVSWDPSTFNLPYGGYIEAGKASYSVTNTDYCYVTDQSGNQVLGSASSFRWDIQGKWILDQRVGPFYATEWRDVICYNNAGGVSASAHEQINVAPAPTYTFNSNGGTPTYTSVTGVAGSAVSNPGSPTQSGYIFTGWSPTLPTTIPSGGGSSVAQWSAGTCANGGAACTCDTLPPGGVDWNATIPSSSTWVYRVWKASNDPSKACTYYCDSTYTWDESSCVATPTVTLTPANSTINSGQSQTLTWITTGSPTSCTLSSVGAVSSSGGNHTFGPLTTTSTYDIYCSNGSVNSLHAMATVTVLIPTINSFTVAPTRVHQGGGTVVTIKWSTTDVTSCVVKKSGSPQTQIGSDKNSPAEGISDTVTTQTTYTITCDSSLSKSVTVNVVPSYEVF